LASVREDELNRTIELFLLWNDLGLSLMQNKKGWKVSIGHGLCTLVDWAIGIQQEIRFLE
jgi:hypothetical protein